MVEVPGGGRQYIGEREYEQQRSHCPVPQDLEQVTDRDAIALAIVCQIEQNHRKWEPLGTRLVRAARRCHLKDGSEVRQSRWAYCKSHCI